MGICEYFGAEVEEGGEKELAVSKKNKNPILRIWEKTIFSISKTKN